jgi:oligopeptide transport system substrate-binding protein
LGGTDFAEGKASADKVGIEVKDDKTLVVQFEKPTPFFISLTVFVTNFSLNEKFVSTRIAKNSIQKQNPSD